jgi:hypothetical protein
VVQQQEGEASQDPVLHRILLLRRSEVKEYIAIAFPSPRTLINPERKERPKNTLRLTFPSHRTEAERGYFVNKSREKGDWNIGRR